jgi:hypothetical protein
MFKLNIKLPKCWILYQEIKKDKIQIIFYPHMKEQGRENILMNKKLMKYNFIKKLFD